MSRLFSTLAVIGLACPAGAEPKKPGLPNFHKVSSTLYRGAQPTAEGMRELERMGIKTVVSLRALHEDEALPGTSLERVSIRFKTWHPEDEDVVRFLKIAADPERAPVFVHCKHGSDRTGTMIAVYRIAVQGWTKGEAIREMTEGGFGFHPMWGNLKRYLRGLDVGKLKRKAGLGARLRTKGLIASGPKDS